MKSSGWVKVGELITIPSVVLASVGSRLNASMSDEEVFSTPNFDARDCADGKWASIIVVKLNLGLA